MTAPIDGLLMLSVLHFLAQKEEGNQRNSLRRHRQQQAEAESVGESSSQYSQQVTDPELFNKDVIDLNESLQRNNEAIEQMTVESSQYQRRRSESQIEQLIASRRETKKQRSLSFSEHSASNQSGRL